MALLHDTAANLPNSTKRMLDVGGRSIATYDTGGSKPPIFFVHGNSSSARAWSRQFDGPLAASHRLIAIDLPGHGASAYVTEVQRATTYNLPGYAAVLSEVTRQTAAGAGVFVGWSFSGGHIVLEAARQLLQAKGFLIFGTPPIAFPPDMSAFLKLGLGFVGELSEAQAKEYSSEFMTAGATDVPDFLLADVLATDGDARAQLGASLAPNGYADEVAIVAAMRTPLAVLQGQGEQIVNPAYLAALKMPTLWRGAVQTVPGAGHMLQWEQAAEFDRLLGEFATECGRGA